MSPPISPSFGPTRRLLEPLFREALSRFADARTERMGVHSSSAEECPHDNGVRVQVEFRQAPPLSSTGDMLIDPGDAIRPIDHPRLAEPLLLTQIVSHREMRDHYGVPDLSADVVTSLWSEVAKNYHEHWANLLVLRNVESAICGEMVQSLTAHIADLSGDVDIPSYIKALVRDGSEQTPEWIDEVAYHIRELGRHVREERARFVRHTRDGDWIRYNCTIPVYRGRPYSGYFNADPFFFRDGASEDAALKLLKEHLSPEQLACYERHTYFHVTGGHSGKTYRIHYGRQQNIKELDKNGRVRGTWCFLPTGDVPAGDCMLAQKLGLELGEKEVLKIANWFPGSW